MLFKYQLMNKLSKSLCNRCLTRLLWSDHKRKDFEMNEKFKNKRLPKTNCFYIKDIKIAEIVAKHLSNDLPNDNSVIFVSSPGEAVLTEHLLRSGAQLVRVFEDNDMFLDNLKRLQNQFPNRLQIYDKQIQNLPKFVNKLWEDYEQEVNNWFSDIPVRDWRSAPPIKFVAILSHKNSFLRFIINELLKKGLFFTSGRTEFLMFVSEGEHKYMVSKPGESFLNYRSVSVLYSTLFDIETLETVPFEEFAIYPNSNDKKKKRKKSLEKNAILVRLTPKLYLDQFSPTFLKEFSYFVKQTFMKRKNWIIPFLENWFPNCGPDVIKRGIPVFKQFGDLRPEEVLDLFQYFHSRDDYQNSLYKTFAMRDNLYEDLVETTETKEEDIEDIDVKEKDEICDQEL